MKITKAELKQIIREEASAMNIVLDLVGLIPGIGPVADLANAIDYTRKGDYLFAGLSVISMLPVIGDVIGTGGKVGVWLAKAFPKGSKMISKYGPEVLETIKDLQVAIIANEKLIDELFDTLENSGQFEDLTEHLPRIREALHVFSGKRMSGDESEEADVPEAAEEITEGTRRMKITKKQLKEIIADELSEVCFEEPEEEIIAETEADLAQLASSLDPETLEALKIIGQAGWKVASEFLTPAALALFGAAGIRKGLGYNDTDPE